MLLLQVAVALTALDAALWAAPGAATAAVPAYRRLGVRPFDHDRRLTSSLVDGPDGPRVVVKGAPAADTSRSTWLGRSTRVARHQACRS
jgi:P-type Mg2+ transporter